MTHGRPSTLRTSTGTPYTALKVRSVRTSRGRPVAIGAPRCSSTTWSATAVAALGSCVLRTTVLPNYREAHHGQDAPRVGQVEVRGGLVHEQDLRFLVRARAPPCRAGFSPPGSEVTGRRFSERCRPLQRRHGQPRSSCPVSSKAQMGGPAQEGIFQDTQIKRYVRPAAPALSGGQAFPAASRRIVPAHSHMRPDCGRTAPGTAIAAWSCRSRWARGRRDGPWECPAIRDRQGVHGAIAKVDTVGHDNHGRPGLAQRWTVNSPWHHTPLRTART